MPPQASTQDAFSLELRKGVEARDGALFALTDEPWLSWPQPCTLPFKRFVTISYQISRGDAPVRPVIRFWLGADRWQDYLMPAPTEGLGVWHGLVPAGCTDVWISPTNRKGPFSFSIIDARTAALSEIGRRAIFAPKRLFFALSAGLVGLREESALNWMWALGSERLDHYSQWMQVRRAGGPPLREIEISNCELPPLFVVIEVDGAGASAIAATCRSLESQSYKNWRVLFHGTPTPEGERERTAWLKKPRFDFLPQQLDRRAGIVGVIASGDVFAPEALQCFAAHFQRQPSHRVVYADETVIDETGAERRIWKPGWSPTLARSVDYLGSAVFLRTSLLGEMDDWPASLTQSILQRALQSERDAVGAIPRSLMTVKAPKPRVVPPFEPIHAGSQPLVSIVIPTRDKPELLRDCLESLFEKTTYENYRVVLVDNDSIEPRTERLIARLQAAHDRLMVLRAPGPFNFSLLSNAGAKACDSEFLLFLNNDTSVVTPDWIERLLYFARQPDIGAVGAKLLYPNGRTQHAGVVLGMGGVAGHFGAGLEAQAPGWLGRNLFPHEVSAVTGACLMVERQKFEAVGKFDEENLPVELNDVDLCLRLGSHGWRSICNTQVVLIHHQSASRGGGLRLQHVYEPERKYFVERWRSVIRDDPYFHPGLSLYAYDERLP